MPFDGNGFRDPLLESQPGEPSAPLPPLTGRQRRWRFGHLLSPCRIGAMLLLKRARALIAQEETWVQGHYSGAGGGYCAIGALLQAGGRRNRKHFEKAAKCLQEVAESRGFRSVEEMNDRCGHAQVLVRHQHD